MSYTLKSLRAPFYKFFLLKKERFTCPICAYSGPFKDKGSRKHAKCPKCGENERARLQNLVFKEIFRGVDCSRLCMLHIAPEKTFRDFFRAEFGHYVSADLYRSDVDFNFDVQKIPFEDASFDVVFASHVLEYPANDLQAIAEIRRILKPNGIAFLPVPIMHEKTIDLEIRNVESRLMHEAGMDYFDRFSRFFDRVELHKSNMYSGQHQLLIYENSDQKPTELKAENGAFMDVVPVCFVGNI